MRNLRSIISIVLLATVGLLAALISPLTVMLASVSIIAFLAIARQINFYKIAMMLKNYSKSVYRLRIEIRAKLHTGFRDYSGSIDSEESSHRHRNCGFVR